MRLALGLLCLALAACSAEAVPEPAGAPTAPLPTPTASTASGPLSWGPTPEQYAAAQASVAAMDDEHLAGQAIVGRWHSTRAEDAVALVGELHLAGLLHQGANITDVDQLGAVNAAVHAAVRADGRPWPGLTAVDQEGGLIARVPAPLTQLPTFMTFGAARDPAVAESAARASGSELRGIGFTVVFSPNADVTTGPADASIGSRSAGDDPAVVSGAVTGALAGYAEAGLVGVPKHFPGHGAATTDSHDSLPVISTDLATLTARDLPPFAAAVDAGASAVMLGHLDLTSLDPGVPSSVSSPTIALLREQLGFEGVVVTDSLGMGAITTTRDQDEVAVEALGAGADLLLMPADPRGAHAAVVAALRDGRLDRARVRDAATRVVALLLHQERLAAASGPALAPGEGRSAAVDASLAGLVVADGPCSGPLVGDRVNVTGGLDADRGRFADAARAAGLRLGGGTTVQLLGGKDSAGSADVVVALDAPWGLGRSRAGTARLALGGRTAEAFEALVAVLQGRAPARGHLPVAVEGLPAGAGCP